MSSQCISGDSAGLFRGLSLDRASTKVTEDNDSALADHLFGRLVYSGQHPADTRRYALIRHRAVSDSEVRLLNKTVTIDLQDYVVVPSCLAAIERRVDQRPKDMPDLAPALAEGLAQRVRVLRAEHWTVRVVIDRHVLRSPPQQQWKAIGEEKPDHHPQSG